MELITYDATNIKSKARGKLIITLNNKHGHISISNDASKMMGLREGSHVKFHQDKNSPEDWYIEKVEEGGFEVQGKMNKKGRDIGVQFRRKEFVLQFFEKTSVKRESISLKISNTPVQMQQRVLWGMIFIGLKD
jgi:hypothetical protein